MPQAIIFVATAAAATIGGTSIALSTLVYFGVVGLAYAAISDAPTLLTKPFSELGNS